LIPIELREVLKIVIVIGIGEPSVGAGVTNAGPACVQKTFLWYTGGHQLS
jgi:hypothetical protein